MKRLSLSLVFALAAAPVAAQAPAPTDAEKAPAAGELKVDMGKLKGTAGGGKLTQPKLVAQAREITRGYYDALIAGNYEQAVGFMHPDAIEPTRARILETLEKATDGQRKATLTSLGVPDLNTLRTMPVDRFFLTWARSPLGQPIQALANKDVKVRVVVDPPRCVMATRSCQVRVTLRGDGKDGKKIEKPNMVFIREHAGRFLLSDGPAAQPTKKGPTKKGPAKGAAPEPTK